jgi:Asp-tRNA(Asn)/Glu-tRNA(Gln) amidotransferase B subunit
VLPAQFAALLQLVDDKKINQNTAKRVLEAHAAPAAILRSRSSSAREGLAMLSDNSLIEEAMRSHLHRQSSRVDPLPGWRRNSSAFLWGS